MSRRKSKKTNKERVRKVNLPVEVKEEQVVDQSTSFDHELTMKYNEEDPLNAMDIISRDASYADSLLKYTDPKISENQFKLFIIAQCKREMYKLVEYSKWLDILEKRFKEVTVDRVDELSPGQLTGIIKFLKENIQSSNELINSVIKDKDITNVLIIGNQTNNINDLTRSDLLNKLYKASVDKDETPASSRSKVVEVVTEILKEDMPSEEINQLTDILTSNQEITEEIIQEPTVIEESAQSEQVSEQVQSIEEKQEEVKEEKEDIDVSKLDLSNMSNEDIDKALKMLQESEKEGGN